MSGGRAARRLGTVAMAGAALQLVYGVLAVVWPYPLIIAPAPELVWGVVNLGMLAGSPHGWRSMSLDRDGSP
jgi:hypothetical protein